MTTVLADRRADPGSVARAITDRFEEAWEREGGVPGDLLTDDVIYTNLGGRIFEGRQSVVDGTRKVKALFLARVTNRDLVDAREIGPGVILARVLSTADILEGPRKGEARGHQLYVIVWDTDAWRIAAYQNTQIAG